MYISFAGKTKTTTPKPYTVTWPDTKILPIPIQHENEEIKDGNIHEGEDEIPEQIPEMEVEMVTS